MKLLKNSLCIIALLAMNAIDAKPVGGAKAAAKSKVTSTPTPAPAPASPPRTTITTAPAPELPPRPASTTTSAPALPSRSFQSLMLQIRSMPWNQVINNEGIMTDAFIQLALKNDLDLALKRELLEAGKNLHLPTSGNSEQDKETMQYAGERIDGLMNDMANMEKIDIYINPMQISPQPLKPLSSAKPSTIFRLSFYDESTHLLKQGMLEQRIKRLRQEGNNDTQISNMLKEEFNPQMISIWAETGQANTAVMLDKLANQIDNAISPTTTTRLTNIQAPQLRENFALTINEAAKSIKQSIAKYNKETSIPRKQLIKQNAKIQMRQDYPQLTAVEFEQIWNKVLAESTATPQMEQQPTQQPKQQTERDQPMNQPVATIDKEIAMNTARDIVEKYVSDKQLELNQWLRSDNPTNVFLVQLLDELKRNQVANKVSGDDISKIIGNSIMQFKKVFITTEGEEFLKNFISKTVKENYGELVTF